MNRRSARHLVLRAHSMAVRWPRTAAFGPTPAVRRAGRDARGPSQRVPLTLWTSLLRVIDHCSEGSPVITHPEKLLFPEDGITKGELAAYYEAVAPLMLPHIRG